MTSPPAAVGPDDTGPPLSGLRVLELTTAAAGQTAGMLLADLGADVVRVQDGEVLPSDVPGWLCRNRGKQLVRGPAAAAELDRLLQRADVLLADHRPSELQAAELGAEELRRRAPSLVSVWLPPVGTSGPDSELPHDHLLLDALGGFAAHHPATEDRPVASVVPMRHAVQGALGAVAALAALVPRERDGWGRAVTVSGLHAEAACLNTVMARTADGSPMLSAGKLLPGPPNFTLYQAGDGRWLFLAALSPDLFITALDALDRLEVLAHPDVAGEFLNILRPEVGAMVGAEIAAALASAPADAWLERLAQAGVPAAAVGDPGGWLTSEVLAHACPPVRRQAAGLGEVLLPGHPATLGVDVAEPGQLPDPDVSTAADQVWRDAEARPAPGGPPPATGELPLAGLRVVDLATFLAGPFVSTLLASHGAEVVKVEAPSGDPYAVWTASYGVVNEHKPRLSADLTTPQGRDELLRLAAAADVVVDNLVASSLARLELTPDRFEAANPMLVRCSLTAYGAEGPFAEAPGFDPVMQSRSGLVAVQGGDGRPIATTAPVHDVAAGCVGALGTLAALWVRTRRGRAQRVQTSLAAASAFLQAAELTAYEGRPSRPTGGPDFAGPGWSHRLYRAADRWIAVAATTPAQQQDLRAVVGAAGTVGDDEASDETRAEAIGATVGTRPAGTWVDELRAAGVPACQAVNRFEMDHPFLAAHHYAHLIDTVSVGRLEVVGGYADWHGLERRPPLPADALRTDAATVLRTWDDASPA